MSREGFVIMQREAPKDQSPSLMINAAQSSVNITSNISGVALTVKEAKAFRCALSRCIREAEEWSAHVERRAGE